MYRTFDFPDQSNLGVTLMVTERGSIYWNFNAFLTDKEAHHYTGTAQFTPPTLTIKDARAFVDFFEQFLLDMGEKKEIDNAGVPVRPADSAGTGPADDAA